MASEKLFENQLKRWLESNGIYALGTAPDKMPVPPIGYYVKRWGGGQYVKSGLPDMQIVICGICFEVELKAENGKLSELQAQKLEQIDEAWGKSFVAKPSDFKALKYYIWEVLNDNGYDITADNLIF